MKKKTFQRLFGATFGLFFGLLAALFATATTAATATAADSQQELEDVFFEILWRCDSPLLVERNAAEDELTRRFVEFEPIWQKRDFLTNGEISAEARQRFVWAELRNRANVERRTLESFRTNWDVGTVETSPSEGTETRAYRVQIAWDEPTRIVYLTPNLRSFVWIDPNDGSVWRPRDRFSEPEISPEFDATSLEINGTLERIASANETDLNNKETTDSAGNGAVDALLGVDFREIAVPLQFETGDEANAKTDVDLKTPQIDFSLQPPQTFRIGNLTLSVAPTRRQKNGKTTAILQLEFDEAFDAFDSHRVWFDANDFAASIDAAKLGVQSQSFSPIRLRTRSRNVRGVSIELDFSETATAAFEKAVCAGASVQLRCRVPRFFLFARIPFRDNSL